ncbi:MAG: aminotransferase class III-fold pyridoxal phosphate-dependent enzyme, partial [Clostridia bacterium]|nr:aminotransferase class III-fold pyridoxal phosphate-dependent enzyme [Clostridia bacterium]
TLKNSFHGRTLTTLSATGQDRFHELFKPLTPGFVYVTANDEKELEEILKTEKIAAVMIECIQGEGGVMALSGNYVKKLFELAKKYDVLTIVDEVQTGNGRSGMLYSYMNFGVSPDIVSTAKGLGGGLPLGATMLSEKLENVFGPGDHGSTFGGNPVCCAGAISVIDRLDEEFLKTVREKSKYIFDALSGAKGIKSVSGMGLMIGLETEKAASDVVNECIENGVLCLTAKNKVRLLPALNIPYDALEKALSVIKSACAD